MMFKSFEMRMLVVGVSALLLTSSASAELFSPTGIDVFDADTQMLNNRGTQFNAIDGDVGTFS